MSYYNFHFPNGKVEKRYISAAAEPINLELVVCDTCEKNYTRFYTEPYVVSCLVQTQYTERYIVVEICEEEVWLENYHG